MLAYFDRTKTAIAKVLDAYAATMDGQNGVFRPFGEQPGQTLSAFSSRGKMIRGGLVALSYNLYHRDTPTSVIQAAAAIELVQSGMLIQDDVMDRDAVRRGAPAIHAHFEQEAHHRNLRSGHHLASSMAVCMGDMAFFQGMDLLNEAVSRTKRGSQIIALFAKELSKVGWAQMADLYFAASSEDVSSEQIWDIYRYKTGRYSFALPLAIGAHLANAPQEDIARLWRVGENLGLVFQAKDDEIGLWGSENTTGKPVGSDIKEGKKTVLWASLAEHLSRSEKAEVLEFFGRDNINGREVLRVRSLMSKYNVRGSLEKKLRELSEAAFLEIDALEGTRDEALSILKALVRYNLHRSR